jgi:hypothetical protein
MRSTGRRNRMRDAVSAGDVILFNKYRIEQANSMIDSATTLDGVFLLESKAWQRLAGIENAAISIRDGSNILRGNGCCGGHQLQEIERRAFGRQDRPRGTAQVAEGLASVNRIAIVKMPVNFDRSIDLAHNLVEPWPPCHCHRFARDNSRFDRCAGLYEISSDVAGANVL